VDNAKGSNTAETGGSVQLVNSAKIKGGTLEVSGPLFNYDSKTKTLTNGTYIVDGTSGSSTMKLSLGSSGGEIVYNAASLILSGSNTNVSFIDAGGQQLLSALVSNTTATSSLTIEDGYNLTTPGDFTTRARLQWGRIAP
jgi:hypothetical protein